MATQKPIYVGVFLDPASKEKLLALVPPKHAKVFAEHLTLAFGKAMAPQYELGKQISVSCCGVAVDDKGQAVLVAQKGLEDLLAPGQLPHVTVSCAEGVPPKYSGELLAKGGAEVFASPLTLTGVLDYYPRTLP